MPDANHARNKNLAPVSPPIIVHRCGVHALKDLLTLPRRTTAHVDLLDLRSSADTAGPPDRVVGYGAFAVTTP